MKVGEFATLVIQETDVVLMVCVDERPGPAGWEKHGYLLFSYGPDKRHGRGAWLNPAPLEKSGRLRRVELTPELEARWRLGEELRFDAQGNLVGK